MGLGPPARGVGFLTLQAGVVCGLLMLFVALTGYVFDDISTDGINVLGFFLVRITS